MTIEEMFENEIDKEIEKINKKRNKDNKIIAKAISFMPRNHFNYLDGSLYGIMAKSASKSVLDEYIETHVNDNADAYSKSVVKNIRNKKYPKNSDFLQMMILISLINGQIQIKNEIRETIKKNISDGIIDYKKRFNLSKDINIDKTYDNSLLWNGTSWEDRFTNNLVNLSTALLSTMTLDVNKNASDSTIIKNLNDKLNKNLSYNTKTLLSTESTAFLSTAIIALFLKNGIETVIFRRGVHAKPCAICDQYANKKFSVFKVPVLPLHPNEKCWYEPVLK